MKNIHILPTDKLSRFHTWINNRGLRATLYEQPQLEVPNTAKNIYITSDEEIKEDWEGYAYKEDVTTKVFKHFYTTNEWYKDAKKIVLTTDLNLIKDGVQAIDDEFLNWFVKNPSCEEVEVIKGSFDLNPTETILLRENYVPENTFDTHKIIIPEKEELKPIHQQIIDAIGGEDKFREIAKIEPKQDCFLLPDCTCKEPDFNVMKGLCKVCGNSIIHLGEKIEVSKQETLDEFMKTELEEAALKLYPISMLYDHHSRTREKYDCNLVSRNAFIEGAKWQQKRSYGEEDLKTAFNVGFNVGYNDEQSPSYLSFEKWFEKFKKK